MKKRISLVIVSLCGFWASTLIGADTPPAAPPDTSAPKPPPLPSPAIPSAEKKLPPTTEAVPSKPLPPELAESKATEKAIAAHIKSPRTPVTIAVPPPLPLVEKKLPAPAEGFVWVPGHWRPVAAQWQWTPGEWATPATPVSVWIEPSYDPKTRQWISGYWQPDRAESYEAATTPKDAPPPAPPK